MISKLRLKRAFMLISAWVACLVFFQNCNGIGTPLEMDNQTLNTPSPGPNPNPNPAPYGLNVDFNEQSLTNFVQASSTLSSTGVALTSDAQGWPQQDFQFFHDNRYVFAWVNGALNVDPLHYATDISGNYNLSFNGQATLTGTGGVIISTPSYDSGTNTTSAVVTFPNTAGGAFFGITFSGTKRTAASAAGTGVTNLKILRASSHPIFTDAWLHQVKDFSWTAFRFMGATGTNDYGASGSNEAYPYRLQWTDRVLPDVGPLYSTLHPGIHGVPWEYVVEVSHQTNRDLWINVPVNASDDYVLKLAQLFHDGNAATGNAGVSATTNIYVEYSNEMWHLGFPQGPWNKQAAVDEVAAGQSNLNYDGINNQEMYRFRRIAKRTIEIGRIFKGVFSDRPTVIRPVINNAWPGFYADMLNYVSVNYGPPANDLYGISMTGYYTSSNASSVGSILQGEIANSDANRSSYLQTRTIATFYGLHSLVYEGGESETGTVQGATPADPTLANKFAAARDPGMQQVMAHDLLNNWYPSGGELYMQFAQVGRYSVYGFWGLSDDLNNLTSGKWLGAKQVLSADIPVAVPGFAVPMGVGQSALIPEIVPPNVNWTVPSDMPWLQIPIQVSVAGTYSIQLQGRQTAAGNLQIWVDNVKIGTVTLGTTAVGGVNPVSTAVQVVLNPGLHSIFVYGPAGAGPGGVSTVASDRLSLTRVQ